MRTAAMIFLFALACNAAQMYDADGHYRTTVPSRWATADGVADGVDAAWLVDNAEWSYATPAEIAAEEAAAAQAAAEAQAARIAAVAPEAGLFRMLLRDYFGPGAETNTTITAQYVTAYFIGKQLAGTITAQDLGAATLLERGFETIKSVTGDGTIWSFPWASIPEPEE